MANNILLRILVAARPGIQAGKLKLQDIVSEYFKQTGGKTLDQGDRTIIENEFIEFAPSNVTVGDFAKGFLGEGDIVNKPSTVSQQKWKEFVESNPFDGTVDVPPSNVRFGSNIDYDAFAKQFNLNVEDIRGKNYQEIMEIAKSQNEGIGSMIPKEYYGYNRGKGGEFTKIPGPVYMDDIIASERPLDTSRIKNWSQRDDYAKFIRKMRGEQFENPTIRKIVKDSAGDIGEGKRAATSIARAAEMVADTKVKQAVLSDLDEMKLEKGPRWWKGDDRYENIEGPMGADDRAEMTKNLSDKVYRSVMEDLDNLVGEDKSYEILKDLGSFSGNRRQYINDPDAFVQAIKEELEFNDVKYDMTFWENYVNEIMQLTTPEIPRFEYGGLV